MQKRRSHTSKVVQRSGNYDISPPIFSLPKTYISSAHVIEQGLARSMPTSGALDRVAQKLNLPFYEVWHLIIPCNEL